MLVGFLCNFTSVLCSIAFFFWAAFGREWSQTSCSLCLQQWPGCLICTVSLTFVTNELIPWDLTSTSIIHFVQIDTILIYHFQIYPGRKLLCLEQRGKKTKEGEEKEKHTGFSKILSDLLGMGQVRQSSVQIKTSVWHWSITRAWEEVKYIMILSLNPCIHFYSALT